MIQTYNPEHYSIQTAKTQDYGAFYQAEISVRKIMAYPPISNLMLVMFTAKQQKQADWAASYLAALIKKAQIAELKMIGPANALIGKMNDIYRKVIYIKHSEYHQLVRLKDRLELFLKDRKEFKEIHISFDFNPMNGF